MPPLPLLFGSFNKTNTTVEDGSKVFASGKTRWFLSFFDTQTIVIVIKTEILRHASPPERMIHEELRTLRIAF
jgi:hypothetical protein